MGRSGEHTPKLDYEKESQNRPDFMGKLSDRELLNLIQDSLPIPSDLIVHFAKSISRFGQDNDLFPPPKSIKRVSCGKAETQVVAPVVR